MGLREHTALGCGFAHTSQGSTVGAGQRDTRRPMVDSPSITRELGYPFLLAQKKEKKKKGQWGRGPSIMGLWGAYGSGLRRPLRRLSGVGLRLRSLDLLRRR